MVVLIVFLWRCRVELQRGGEGVECRPRGELTVHLSRVEQSPRVLVALCSLYPRPEKMDGLNKTRKQTKNMLLPGVLKWSELQMVLLCIHIYLRHLETVL